MVYLMLVAIAQCVTVAFNAQLQTYRRGNWPGMDLTTREVQAGLRGLRLLVYRLCLIFTIDNKLLLLPRF
jgi:hypothetical protein